MPSNTKGRGVLPINAAQTRKQFKQTPRPPAPRLRLIIRRLPPGLTEAEFWECIEAEWHVGQGKVDWADFKLGKISRDLAKPSRPARAYLKVKEPAHLDQLSAHVKAVTFQDAKNSTRDPCLIGPPSLEFAPYSKIPSSRVRHDGRQGTIDQDPEFIDFLQSLTQPITKASANGDGDGKQEKVTITPLVQYIKDKKANKAKEKEAATTKTSKKGQDSKDAKNTSPSKSDQTNVVKKSTSTDAEKARVAKATQQAVDSIKRSVAEIKGQAPTKQEQPVTKTPATPTQSTPKRERQRGDASAAARIIGRDLGLVPKEGRTPRTPRAASTPAGNTNTPPTGPAAIKSSPPQVAASPQPSSAQPPTGPRNLRNATPQPSPLRPNSMPQQAKAAKSSPQPAPSGKSAFLKHANPSQGVTEDLLRSTFSAYGTLTRCEIDKKKGLGYLDFTDTDGLRKALAASPIKIGNGNVVVLENRSPYKKGAQAPSTPNNATSPLASNASSPQVAHASLASVAEQAQPAAQPGQSPFSESSVSAKMEATAAAASTPAPTTPSTTNIATADPSSPTSAAQPPSAPRGGAGNRGNARGNFRGRGYRGRGGQFGRGGNRAASTPVGGGSAQSTPSAGGGDAKS